MSDRRLLSGRTVTLLVLATLVVTVCAAVYVAMVRLGPLERVPVDSLDYAARVEATRRLTLLLSILLVSSLLILLFALGAYMVIRIGRLVARTRTQLGGTPTEYSDAWRQYRLTDEQISAATTESPAGDTTREPPPDEKRPDDHDEDDPHRHPRPES